jgi:hypothetical protein
MVTTFSCRSVNNGKVVKSKGSLSVLFQSREARALGDLAFFLLFLYMERD